jgi:S-adenosyl-L-methionine hydrolase (adenosine-forming)
MRSSSASSIPTSGRTGRSPSGTASGCYLVGPDNGLLSLAWEAAGGVSTVAEITSPDVVRPPRAESFRAPDTLCRAAAHLAAGSSIEQLGPTVDAATLNALTLAEPEVTDGQIRGEVLDFNRFGNIQVNVREADLARAGLDDAAVLTIKAMAGSAEARRGSAYADFKAGEYGVIDERGWMEIVRENPASVLEGLGLSLGHLVWIGRSRVP